MGHFVSVLAEIALADHGWEEDVVPVDGERRVAAKVGMRLLLLWIVVWGGLVKGHGQLLEGLGTDRVVLDDDGLLEHGGFPGVDDVCGGRGRDGGERPEGEWPVERGLQGEPGMDEEGCGHGCEHARRYVCWCA